MTEKLAAVIVALNKVETHGKDNMTRLLGCIKMLEEVLEAEKNKAAETAE